MVRVRRIDGDAAHEPSRRQRRVDTVESHIAGRRVVGVGRYKHTSAPEPGPERTVVARRPLRCNDVASGPRSLISSKRCASQIGPNRHPVAAGTRELQTVDELAAVRLQKRLITAIVLRPPDVLRTEEPRAAHARVRDQWDVEGHVLAAQTAWVPDPVPPRLVAREPAEEGAAVEPEVYVDLRRACLVEECVHPDVGIADINARLPAVPENANEAAPVLAVDAMGAVVLRPAHQVVKRVLDVDRQALVLERAEPPVH